MELYSLRKGNLSIVELFNLDESPSKVPSFSTLTTATNGFLRRYYIFARTKYTALSQPNLPRIGNQSLAW
jgi:hypothetical protein